MTQAMARLSGGTSAVCAVTSRTAHGPALSPPPPPSLPPGLGSFFLRGGAALRRKWLGARIH